jgi:hypothetical protein
MLKLLGEGDSRLKKVADFFWAGRGYGMSCGHNKQQKYYPVLRWAFSNFGYRNCDFSLTNQNARNT